MRRFELWFILILVILLAGWGLVWWFIAGRIGASLDEAIAGSADGEIAIACGQRGQRGFPFQFQIVCADASAEPANGEWRIRLARLQAGAWAHRPRHIEALLEGPVELTVEALERPVTSDWASANAEIFLGDDGPRELSLRFFSPKAQIADSTLTTHRTWLNILPGNGGDISRVTLAAEQLRVTAGGNTLPPIDLTFDGATPIPPEALLGGDIDRSGGLSLSDIVFNLKTEPVQAFAQGALEVGADGLVDGTVDLYLVGIENLPALLGALPQGIGSAGNVLTGALLALAAPAEWQGLPARRIVINIDNGEVRAGALSLGRLPPLWRPAPST